MKKIYFQPACIIVELSTQQMMAESAPNVTIGGGEIEAGDVEVKETNTINFNIWDEVW